MRIKISVRVIIQQLKIYFVPAMLIIHTLKNMDYVTIVGAVAHLRMTAPERLNALSDEMLAALKAQPDFDPLAAAFKRVGNIIKDQAPQELTPGALVDAAEKTLNEVHDAVAREVDGLLGDRAFDAALRRITDLKPDVDRFFDNVMVMVEDGAVRANRIALLQSISSTFGRIADFGRIQIDKS